MRLTRDQVEHFEREGHVYLSLCAVSNRIRRFKRPEHIAHRDFTPIECLADDCRLPKNRDRPGFPGEPAGKPGLSRISG